MWLAIILGISGFGVVSATVAAIIRDYEQQRDEDLRRESWKRNQKYKLQNHLPLDEGNNNKIR
jgi:hypothetical protein